METPIFVKIIPICISFIIVLLCGTIVVFDHENWVRYFAGFICATGTYCLFMYCDHLMKYKPETLPTSKLGRLEKLDKLDKLDAIATINDIQLDKLDTMDTKLDVIVATPNLSIAPPSSDPEPSIIIPDGNYIK